MMQVIDEDDAVDALVHAVVSEIGGVYNVAADGFMSLFQIMRQANKIPLPVFHLFAYSGVSWFKRQKGWLAPLDIDYLRYPCMGDLMKMNEELGFMPTYSPQETLQRFRQNLRGVRYESSESDEYFNELEMTIEERQMLHDAEINEADEEIESDMETMEDDNFLAMETEIETDVEDEPLPEKTVKASPKRKKKVTAPTAEGGEHE
jgi:hypothetical protein